MGNSKGIENYFELTGGLSYRGFELPGVDCTYCFIVPFIHATYLIVYTFFNS